MTTVSGFEYFLTPGQVHGCLQLRLCAGEPTRRPPQRSEVAMIKSASR